MAVGAAITSARTTALMRRVNALENDWLFDWETREFTGTTTGFITDGTRLVDSGGSFTKYISVSDTCRNDTDALSSTSSSIPSDTEINVNDSGTFPASGKDYTITAKKVYRGSWLPALQRAGGDYIFGVASGSHSGLIDGDIFRTDEDLLALTKIIDKGTASGEVDDLEAFSYNHNSGALYCTDTKTVTDHATGSATSTSSLKLIDSNASFLTTVRAGATVNNDTDMTSSTISSVDSDTQLTLGSDIFVSGEDYSIDMDLIRVQKFQYDGTLDREVLLDVVDPDDGEALHAIASLDDGSAAAIILNNSNPNIADIFHLISIDGDDGSQSTILSVDATGTPSSGDPVFIKNLIPWSDGNAAVTIEIDSDYAECRIYSPAGSLIETIPRPTTHTVSSGYVVSSDSFNAPAIITADGRVISQSFNISPTGNISPGANAELLNAADGTYIGTQNAGSFDLSDTGFPGGSTQEGIFIYGQIGGSFYGVTRASPNSRIVFVTTDSAQTEWYRYPNAGNGTGSESLGTPDYGNSVPAADALLLENDGTKHRPHYFELRDIRDAIEAVAPSYKNPATGNAYTLTADADNIFRVAIDSGQDDWTTPTVTHGDMITDEHWNDIELVLTQLEQSELA